MTPKEPTEFIKSALSGVIADAAPAARERIDHVAKLIAGDERFHSFDHILLTEQFEKMIVRLYDVNPGDSKEKNAINALHETMQASRNTMEKAIKTAGAESIRPTPEVIARESATLRVTPDGTEARRSHSKLHNASSSDHWLKVNKALGWIGASMMILGAFSSAQGIVSKDENGNREIHATPLMWTILQGVMGAGILYLTHHQPSTIQNAIR
jgi:hypothetical protein